MLIVGLIPIIAAIILFFVGFENIAYILLAVGILVILFAGFKTVRPIERGVIERFGKYLRTKEAGLTWIIPMIDKMYRVNITEQMVDVLPQMVITKDKLNAQVDAVVGAGAAAVADRDVPIDAVPLGTLEVVDDPLLDVESAVLVDPQVDLELPDPLGPGVRGGAQQQQQQQRRRDERAPHEKETAGAWRSASCGIAGSAGTSTALET